MPHRDRVAVAKQQVQRRALERRAVAHALDHKHALVALRYANHHVVDQRPRKALERAVLRFLGRACHHDLAAVYLDADLGLEGLLQLALRARYRQRAPAELTRYAIGDGHGKISYS